MPMPRMKVSTPHSIRFSRDTINILDDISDELGDLTRRGTIELLARFIRRVRDTSGATYSDLLIKDSMPAPREKGKA